MSKGPLAGIRVLEFAGIGPAPLCGMLFADMGAEVLRLDRLEPIDLGVPRTWDLELANRGKRTLAVDLKKPEGIALAGELVERADVLIEGFRPGTMERLGLGPDVCLARNPKLVYGRVTGFGQDGPLARAAGHDLNYIALAGALHSIGREGAAPTPPLNLLGDYAGGTMFLAWGIACALLEARQSGKGQVVDAAMVDGVSVLMTAIYGLMGGGLHNGPRGTNTLDSGAPYYEVYECADGRYVSVAPIERRFRALLLEKLGPEAPPLEDLDDRAKWPEARAKLAAVFRTRSRDEWCALLEGSDACFAPVLPPLEAHAHPHLKARGTFTEIAGVLQPAPAPRFSRSSPDAPTPPERPGSSGAGRAVDWGIAQARIDGLIRDGVVGKGDRA
ncbi:CoA transferase [Burkholderiaceae bacterium FT117]|uniref:CaiB/BaiF CoA transferase family protein n=1 Tax=Zeimonas sediminis TaxID=2944268 RepID=UPI0023430BC3|nr:CaiB/BaiF CoA-transferase family protein [Zeimonas sediminis]MCM5571420.1 CoA transferase [Zeimonas sediminis]